MKSAILLISLLLVAPTAAVAEPAAGPHGAHHKPAGRPADGALHKGTEKGAFSIDLALEDRGLQNGPNSFDIVLRDRDGKGVEGAHVAITPWMPSMGHGVWEKPSVKERGGGKYHVENVVIIMGGVWELKMGVKKGALEDRGVFTLNVAEAQPAKQEPEAQKAGYDRTLTDYTVPNVTLINQDGKKVNLRTLMDSGKPVIVDFIFTSCTTICPVLSAGFTNLRKELGEDAEKVQLISISIDPENDRPEQLKRYLKRFNGGPGWEFLTGSREDIAKVLRAFNAFVVDKMSHQPLYLLHGADAAQWVRIKGLIKKSDLVREYRKMEKS